jgi:phosphatidylinositol-3-phosphatase
MLRSMSTRGLRLVPILVAVALGVGACSSSGSSKATPTGATGATSTTTPRTARALAPIRHVFIINLENENFESSWGPASPAGYLNHTLRPKGQLLTQYFGIGHASLDNYIAQISGQAPNPETQADCVNYKEFVATGVGAYGQELGAGCTFPKSVPTIADQLHAAGDTWKAYQEDIGNSATEPKTCRHPVIGTVDSTLIAHRGDMYSTKHDPFMYFHSVIDDPSCAKNVVALGAMTVDLASASTTPNLSYITPNLCHDGHDSPCVDGQPGGLTSADRFMRQWVPKILDSPAFKADGMLVITFDEAEVGGPEGDASACCHTPPSPNAAIPGISGPGGGRVGALVISARTKPGSTNATPYNHYALLCSIENVWGFDHLGFAGAPGLECFGTDVYDKSS